MTEVSILGASGYAGGELLRILLFHPYVKVKEVTSRRFNGQLVSLAHPNLRKISDLNFINPDKLLGGDVLFVSLPNLSSMEIVPKLVNRYELIIDLGPDFRIKSPDVFEKWYGVKHKSKDLLKKFVYGVTEINREHIKKAKFVACGGCEATVSILCLYPLVKEDLIKSSVIIDAKMSSSQAGANPSFSSHHPERSGAVRSYMPVKHRHTVEIEQELSKYLSGLKVDISATALDMVRGLLVTTHTKINKGVFEKDIWKAYRKYYEDEPFVRIVKEKQGVYRMPEPKILLGTNYCDIGFELDTERERLVVIGAIDNLVKGTAGQAVQNMNLMKGFKETEGLGFPGLHPI